MTEPAPHRTAKELADLCASKGVRCIQPIRDFLLRQVRYRYTRLNGNAKKHAQLHVIGPHKPLWPGGPSEAPLVERVEMALGDIEAGVGPEKHTIHGGRQSAISLSMAAGMAVLCGAHCSVGEGSMGTAMNESRDLLYSMIERVEE